MDTLSEPIPNAYWVMPGSFLAGPYPGTAHEREAQKKLTTIIDAGVRVFIDLTEEGETSTAGVRVTPYEPLLEAMALERGIGLRHIRLPIRDVSITSVAHMARILDAIDAALEAGKPVYVHCRGGFGRTGTVVGCHLIRHGLAESDTALTRISQLRQHVQDAWHPSPETLEQAAMVRSWIPGA